MLEMPVFVTVGCHVFHDSAAWFVFVGECFLRLVAGLRSRDIRRFVGIPPLMATPVRSGWVVLPAYL